MLDFLKDIKRSTKDLSFDAVSRNAAPLMSRRISTHSDTFVPMKRRRSSQGSVQLPFPPKEGMRTRMKYCSVKQLIDKANENGDGDEARRYYKVFKDANKFWKKTLRFHEDSRPPYEGQSTA